MASEKNASTPIKVKPFTFKGKNGSSKFVGLAGNILAQYPAKSRKRF